MPKVSVIIPVYNREHTIVRALDSVLTQTFRDFEIIVCDDCSTDGSRDIVDGYAAHDSRIKHIKLSQNSGSAVARNAAMREAVGDYIAFLDSDDEWKAGYLKIMVATFDNASAETGLVMCGADIEINAGERTRTFLALKAWECNTLAQFATERMRFMTPAILIRRECLLKCGYMAPELRRGQDIDFFMNILYEYKFKAVAEREVIIHAIVGGRTLYEHMMSRTQYLLANHYSRLSERCGRRIANEFKANLYKQTACAALSERKYMAGLSQIVSGIIASPWFMLLKTPYFVNGVISGLRYRRPR